MTFPDGRLMALPDGQQLELPAGGHGTASWQAQGTALAVLCA